MVIIFQQLLNGYLYIDKTGTELIQTKTNNTNSNAGAVTWSWCIKNLNTPFYTCCLAYSADLTGPECGYNITSWKIGDDSKLYLTGEKFDWINTIPEGPKGDCLREIYSTNIDFMPHGNSYNGKWYKYIGVK